MVRDSKCLCVPALLLPCHQRFVPLWHLAALVSMTAYGGRRWRLATLLVLVVWVSVLAPKGGAAAASHEVQQEYQVYSSPHHDHRESTREVAALPTHQGTHRLSM